MFTGIVSAVGTVQRAEPGVDGFELTVQCSYPDLQLGESIAVDGACLTVQALGTGSFTARVVRPSLDRTLFEQYLSGRKVNLERALRVGDRLGGHLVQGHVEGRGRIDLVEQRGDARVLNLSVPQDIGRVSVPLGSITVDGVSLTVNAKPEACIVQISLIPFTLQHTTLGERQAGHWVHLESDTIGKYVLAFLDERAADERRKG